MGRQKQGGTLKFTSKQRYALAVMVYLAKHENENILVKDLASDIGITAKYIEHVVMPLRKAEYLKALTSVHGGYRLTKGPEYYTVGDILRVTGSIIATTPCLATEYNECRFAKTCAPVNMVYSQLDKLINEFVDSITLADLIKYEGIDIKARCPTNAEFND